MFSDPCKKRPSAPCSHTQSLLDWYTIHARNLPWRNTAEAYRIWISEIMLQQTQVATVLPRYRTWFTTFPDVATLAAAELDDVLKAWEGLGYYRRARFIHQAAQIIVERHHGEFPQTFADMLQLPGIGRSTAGAISSFCLGTSTPVLDGNVKRVLRRWHTAPAATDKMLWEMAQTSIDASDDPAAWNQAMMELGATICLPTRSRCFNCPVQKDCGSAFKVSPEQEKKAPTHVRDVYWRVHLHVDAMRGIWLMQRPDTGIWAGLWSPPISELPNAPDASPCHIHLLSHRRVHLYAEFSDSNPDGAGQWVADLGRYALPTGIHRLLGKHNIP